MTQLILDTNGLNVEMPESQKKGYSAFEEDLSVEVVMVSGRLTREVRGSVWRISYQYGFFDNEMKSKVMEACRKGRKQPIRCGFLEPTSEGVLTYSDFLVTGLTEPKFMWSNNQNGLPVPLWADFGVELREVQPHD